MSRCASLTTADGLLMMLTRSQNKMMELAQSGKDDPVRGSVR